jgi:aspartyl-tRNA(Asn)/glutamyl-tRNA(Gln) amidotransferase subunit A
LPSETKSAETYVEKPRTLAALHVEIASGRTKASELAAAYYERIEKLNPRLNIFLSLTKERALAQAERVDAIWRRRAIRCPPLAGVPMSASRMCW